MAADAPAAAGAPPKRGMPAEAAVCAKIRKLLPNSTSAKIRKDNEPLSCREVRAWLDARGLGEPLVRVRQENSHQNANGSFAERGLGKDGDDTPEAWARGECAAVDGRLVTGATTDPMDVRFCVSRLVR